MEKDKKSMKSLHVIILLSLCLAGKTTAGPDASGVTHVVGHGGIHCLEAEAMGYLGKEEGWSRELMLAWIKGYITARNEFDPADHSGNISNGVSDEEMIRWVRERCHKCPSDRVASAVQFLSEEMWLKQKIGTPALPYDIFRVLQVRDPTCFGQ
ncbi:MAG: hypothetical protein WCD20_02615 [Rhodomicrobium sp.]